MPELSQLVPLCSSLTHVEIEMREDASRAWVHEMLLACAATCTQGALRVQLPRMQATTLQGAKQLWAQLAARAVAPASVVVVTDCEGTDL